MSSSLAPKILSMRLDQLTILIPETEKELKQLSDDFAKTDQNDSEKITQMNNEIDRLKQKLNKYKEEEDRVSEQLADVHEEKEEEKKKSRLFELTKLIVRAEIELDELVHDLAKTIQYRMANTGELNETIRYRMANTAELNETINNRMANTGELNETIQYRMANTGELNETIDNRMANTAELNETINNRRKQLHEYKYEQNHIMENLVDIPQVEEELEQLLDDTVKIDRDNTGKMDRMNNEIEDLKRKLKKYQEEQDRALEHLTDVNEESSKETKQFRFYQLFVLIRRGEKKLKNLSDDLVEMKQHNLVKPDQMNVKINDLKTKLKKYKEEQDYIYMNFRSIIINPTFQSFIK